MHFVRVQSPLIHLQTVQTKIFTDMRVIWKYFKIKVKTFTFVIVHT